MIGRQTGLLAEGISSRFKSDRIGGEFLVFGFRFLGRGAACAFCVVLATQSEFITYSMAEILERRKGRGVGV